MKHLYVVTMPDLSRWGIPIEVIAADRAKYYAEIDSDTTYQVEYDNLIQDFLEGNQYDLEDWARGNMDWKDVKEHAIKLPSEAPKTDELYQTGWLDGHSEFSTVEEEVPLEVSRSDV